MNFSDFITHTGRRICKEHFLHLVQVSRIDGKISDEEMKMLHRKGRKFGLTDPEIDYLIQSEVNHHYTPPISLKAKFSHLYNIAQLILADDVITDSERKILQRFTIEAGFKGETVDNLTNHLLEGIKNGIDEDDLLEQFRKKHLFKD